METGPTEERFDAGYYRRYYGRDPVHDRRRVGQLASAVVSMAAWWRVPLRSVLEVGAGKGYWRDWLHAHRPRVRYHGIDVSPYACSRYGHEQADLATWQPRRAYDLVVCQSMLQYLDDAAATRAIGTLGQATRGLLFLEVPTVADRDGVIDADHADLDIHWRTGRWYRTRLDASFVEIGAALWANRTLDIPFFELERARR